MSPLLQRLQTTQNDSDEEGRTELYDMEKDPSEMNNISEEKPEFTQELLSELNEWKSKF